MFEQTFVKVGADEKKHYSVLLSLLFETAVVGILILVPLIYTQVLPQARLRSVFAAPTPPPNALPKAPLVARTSVARPVFQGLQRLLTFDLRRNPPQPMEAAPDLPPDIPAGTQVGDVYSSTIGTELAAVKPPEPPKTAPPQATRATRVRVGTISESQLIKKVQPQYPAIAQRTHVEGVVEFTAVISKTGTIENLQLVRGHPLLVNAAREAILQWRYKPTLLNGEPVEVITNILVNFTLNQ